MQKFEAPGQGGADVSIYRVLTITQAANSTCVYDWDERLALGSHLYPGSSLHSDLLNQALTTSGIGSKEVSIPVKEISPQAIAKDMSATEDASVSWQITKQGTPATLNFGDVCAANPPASKPATITVTWTKGTPTGDGISVTAHIYATNPSARDLLIDIVDVTFQGTTQTTQLSSLDSGQITLPAGNSAQDGPIYTYTFNLPASDGNVGDSLNDVATATYVDQLTLVPIPGFTTAHASTTIGTGSTADNSANITDSESMTGSGLTFSVPTPSVGDFPTYMAGTATVGPVDWEALNQPGTGSVEFDKTIYLTPFLVTSGTLSDTAHLNTQDQSISSSVVSINISSLALVTLTVSKTIPAGYLSQAGDTLAVYFHIAGAGGYTNDVELDFSNGGSTSNSVDLPGLTPDDFTVTETGSKFCDVADGCTTNTLLTPESNPLTVYLSTPDSGDMTGRCSGTAAFVNEYTPSGIRANVQKVTNPVLPNTDPDYSWTFTLSGPGAASCLPVTVGAGAGYLTFQSSGGGDCLLTDGTYTVTETTKTGWVEDPVSPANPANPLVCTFTVDKIFDDGKTFSCSFHNTRDGHVKVIKTFQNAPPTGTQSFDFTLRDHAGPGNPGNVDEELFANAADGGVLVFQTLLTPGNHYQLCETGLGPGFGNNMKSQFTTAAFDADNSTVCFDFVATTDLQTFTIDNEPPPGNPLSGRTIGYWKNWASCNKGNGHQAPVLDQTIVKATQTLMPPGIEYGSYYFTATSVPAASCANAVSLLNKSAFTGTKMASDPLFNMTAQLIGAELNIVAGDATCAKVNTAIFNANALLINYHFNGITYSPKLAKADATTANNLATLLDNYNNNVPGTCP